MDNLKEILQSILFVAGDAVEFYDIASKLNIDVKEVANALKELQKKYEEEESGIQLLIFNKKAQLCSNSKYANFVAEVLNPSREKALTKAVLEVAAIIAYKQPITRLEIENVRGVNSDYAINTLVENNLIEVVGRKDAIGKPLLFGTTDEFLKRFNMGSLEELPDYEEIINNIKVIETPKDNSLFNFEGTEDDEPNRIVKKFEEPKSEKEIKKEKLDFIRNSIKELAEKEKEIDAFNKKINEQLNQFEEKNNNENIAN